ncbi:UDP-N-acetylglucosamine 2-epimerase [Clostridium neonatale]|uniref:UDP-N-acetylglucosamine 2-epimerase n=1 Tax=Clostridium neonatale TaxID=137838 RepID=UPI003D338B3D
MRKIAVVTGARSEYGLLKNTIRKIYENPNLELELIVTGTHLSRKYGYTVTEIEDDGFEIKKRIPIIDEMNSDICLEASQLLKETSEVFKWVKPDLLLILGDRYEIFIVSTAAMLMNIPICHISGGEITEGAVDDKIRHSITKIANIHFPGTEEYAENIARMGEERWRIFNVGDPGIENMKNIRLYEDKEIEEKIGFKVDKDTLILTFHPVTLEIRNTEEYIDNLIAALKKFNNKIIITYPNSDAGSNIIIDKIKEYEERNKNVKVFKSLGIQLYLSVIKKCGVVVGNSSSGIVEAPYFKIPVVNIGSRQKGRLMAKNIINCNYDSDEIYRSIKKALTDEYRKYVKNETISLYGDGNTSEKIVEVLENINIDEKLIKKRLVW